MKLISILAKKKTNKYKIQFSYFMREKKIQNLHGSVTKKLAPKPSNFFGHPEQQKIQLSVC